MQRQMLRWILAISMCAGLLACRPGWFSYEGTEARPEGRIALESGGPHEGRWRDSDLIVRYTYVRESNRLRLEGQVGLGDRLTKSFGEVRNFSVQAALIDDGNRIAETIVLVSVGNSVIRPWSFNTAVEIGPQVAALNFFYRGTAFDSAEESGKVSASFWKTP